MTSAPKVGVTEARADLRAALVARGFTDDGVLLRGPVTWTGPHGPTTAVVDVTVPDRYPFGPPVVRLHDPGADITVTFHIDPDDALCLWDTAEPAASWTDAEALVTGVAGWLEQTVAGWPADDDTDLERYLKGPRLDRLVLYDAGALTGITGCVRTTESEHTITVASERRNPPARSRTRKRGKSRRHGKTSLPRAQQHLAYVADLGALHAPVRGWDDLAAVLPEAADVRRYVNQGAVELLLLRYTRGGAAGVLVLAVRPARSGDPPALLPCEAADTSVSSRTLRAGRRASALAKTSVTIVGCGAVGSYVADLFYREGVRKFHLVDPDTYRPGNAIRHAAPAHLVGRPKVEAVANALLALGLDEPDIAIDETRLGTPDEALDLMGKANIVIDATADERATALLRWASKATGNIVISACVQREGGIARADRFPLRGDEKHLDAVPLRTDGFAPMRERGCGDVVSSTPVSAVVAAAELAVELARDELLHDDASPASILRVLEPQPDVPYANRVTLSSRPRTGSAAP